MSLSPAGRPAEKIPKILLQQQHQQPDDDDDDDFSPLMIDPITGR